jgi:hypothetical protein
MPATDDLTPIEKLALSRLFDPRTKVAKIAREEVEPGEYSIDRTIHFTAEVTVLEDYTSHIVAKAQPWILFMLLAEKVNDAKLKALVKEALNIDKDSDRVKEFKARVGQAVQELKAPTKTECKGKVQATCLVTPVGKTIAS